MKQKKEKKEKVASKSSLFPGLPGGQQQVPEEKHVSWSEIRAWSMCRKKWYWTYDRNIMPKRERPPLLLGDCGHVALASMLNKQNWKAAIGSWVRSRIKECTETGGLFDEEREEIKQMGQQIKQILTKYNEQQPKLEAVVVEQKFRVPLSLPGYFLIGYWDGIVKDEDGALWLMEHKFPQKTFTAQEDLLLNSQLGLYRWAAGYYGYTRKLVGTIYNQLLCRVPAKPAILKDGRVSKAIVYTDWETYKQTLKKAKQDEQEYLDVKEKIAKFKFFQRDPIYHSDKEIRNYAADFMHKVWDLTRKEKHIYMSDSIMNCRGCPFKELCQEELKGGDIDYLIQENYQQRHRREVLPQPVENKKEKNGKSKTKKKGKSADGRKRK